MENENGNRVKRIISGKLRAVKLLPVGLNLPLAAALVFGLSFGNVAWSNPSIQSVELSPDPLVSGADFKIAVSASPDTTQATALLDFGGNEIAPLEILLAKQGELWNGTGLIPSALAIRLHKDEAKMKVLVLDALGHRDQEIIHLNVVAPAIFADFSDGVLTVSGDNKDNTLIVSRDAAGFILVNGGAIPITGGVPMVANTTLIRIFGLGGNDTLLVDDANGPMPPAHLSGGEGDDTLTGSAAVDELDGGPGNDTLLGRDGADKLIGGPGNDTLMGGRGDDQMFGGDGDDQLVWNPGDGSDVVEGENGTDTLLFNGANVSEKIDLSANGPRLRFFRDVGNITMDCDGVERVVFRALGGADQMVVNELTATEVSQVIFDLLASTGTADGQADTVIVRGTGTNDVITLTGSMTGVTVSGLSAAVTVVGADQGLDQLVVEGLDGDDHIDASAVQPGAIDLTLNGGNGNDNLIGGAGNDLLIGGRGNDAEFGGAGDDTFTWNPGDGNDLIEGQAGFDSLVFNGANIAESVDIAANGQRLRFTRDIAGIVMDCNEIERVQFNALGGADSIRINDLTGTGVTTVNLDLASPAASGNGDNAVDTIAVMGTGGDDVVQVSGSAAGVTVQGFPATVNIFASEGSLDQLIIQTLAGSDVVQASALPAGLINLVVDGGQGDDVLVGSGGNDVLQGGEGDDVLNGGPGQDVLDGGPGANVIIQ